MTNLIIVDTKIESSKEYKEAVEWCVSLQLELGLDGGDWYTVENSGFSILPNNAGGNYCFIFKNKTMATQFKLAGF